MFFRYFRAAVMLLVVLISLYFGALPVAVKLLNNSLSAFENIKTQIWNLVFKTVEI